MENFQLEGSEGTALKELVLHPRVTSLKFKSQGCTFRAALIRMASSLQSAFAYQRSSRAAHFLLGSTVNRPSSLSSLQFHFTQAQTLLAGVWREGGGRERDKGEICDQRETGSQSL